MYHLSNFEVVIILGVTSIVLAGTIIYVLTKNIIRITSFTHLRTRKWMKLLHENKLNIKEFYRKEKHGNTDKEE